MPEDLCPENGKDSYPEKCQFSGCSGGALVGAVLSLGLKPKDCFEMVLAKREECKWNPFRMLPAVEDVVNKMLPRNACELLTKRLRVLLTRVSLKWPVFSAEVIYEYRNNEDAFHALRASCHVPVIG